jgi:protein involved in polysaccharide export with SLBB domain
MPYLGNMPWPGKFEGLEKNMRMCRYLTKKRYCDASWFVARLREMLLVLKRCSCLLLLPLLLSGCLTIHNLNVTSNGSVVPPAGPVAVPTTGGGAGTSTPTPVPIGEMGTLSDAPEASLDSANISYSIHPGDELDIKFYYNPTLNESVKVRPDGRISLQLVQEVQAASLSPQELVSILKQKYSSHIKEPEISVIVRTFEASKIFVDGEVYLPGMIEMPGGELTIMQAIARARGLKDTAKRGDVILIRRNGLHRPFVYTVNLAAAMSGTDITQDVALKPFDIVYVPKSAIANVNTWVDQYIRRNIPISINYDLYRLVD